MLNQRKMITNIKCKYFSRTGSENNKKKLVSWLDGPINISFHK